MSGFSILTATEDHVRIVAALSAATFYEAYVETDDPQDLARYVTEKFSVRSIRRELSDPAVTCYLGAAREKFVGYLKIRRSEPPSCLAGRNLMEIERIYILSKYSGQGLGKALIDKALETAKEEGFDGVWLGVWDENLAAKDFYRKRGFVLAGEMPFEYGDQVFTNEVMLRAI